MPHRHIGFSALIIICSVLGTVRSSPGQGALKPSAARAAQARGGFNGGAPGRAGAQQPPMAVPITFSGTLQQLRGGMLQVANDKQEQYLVKVDPRHTKVQCTGTAESSFLQTGLYVRFTGEFDNHGTSKGDVSELEIVTPSTTVKPGIVRDEPGGLEEKPKKKAKNEGGKYLVVGQIRGVKNGQLMVAPPGVSGGLKVSLAADAKINVDVADASLVQQGDAIEVKGNLVQAGQNGQPGQVAATDVTVKLAKPLSLLSKKAPRAAAGARTNNKKSDKEADSSPPGAAPKQPGA